MEDYIYFKIKDDLNLNENQIKLGIHINFQKDNSPVSENELDVVFVKDNFLYIIESKLYNKNKNNNYYKLSSFHINIPYNLKIFLMFSQ